MRRTGAKGVEYDFEMFQVDPNWKGNAATVELVIAMRKFRSIVKELQREALR